MHTKTFLRHFFIVSFSLFSTVLFAGNPTAKTTKNDGYHITVKINGYKDNVCYLANYYGDKTYIKDTVKLAKVGDPIVFQGKEKLHQGIYLVVIKTTKYFEIVVGENQNFEVETDTVDFVGHLKIKNSTDNQLFLEYLKFTAAKGAEMNALNVKIGQQKNRADSLKVANEMNKVDSSVNAFRKNFVEKNPKMLLASVFKAMPEPIVPKSFPLLPNGRKDSLAPYRYFHDHYFDNVDFSDDRLLYTPIFHGKVDKYLNQLTSAMPDSINRAADFLVAKSRANKEMFKWTVWYITNTYEQSKIMGYDAVFVHMADQYYCKGEAFWIDSAKLKKICERKEHLNKILINAVVPNMMLEDSSLTSYWTNDLMSKYDYMLLWFWNSTCGHCQKETPELYKLWQKIHEQEKLGVITITEERIGSKDDPQMKKWKTYLKEHPMDWMNLRDANNYYDFREMFDVYATPKIFLVDAKTHKILAKQLSVEQVEEVLAQLKKIEKEKQKLKDKK